MKITNSPKSGAKQKKDPADAVPLPPVKVLNFVDSILTVAQFVCGEPCLLFCEY
jgi:hypothetical protein